MVVAANGPAANGPAANGPAGDGASLAELVCLALIAGGVSHGWALGTLLAHDGEVGRIWTLSRPLTYRAVDGLVAKRLVRRAGETSGRGRDRVLLAATAKGRAIANAWLAAPVHHVRDVRTELLVKLALRRRSGLGSRDLLSAQVQALAPTLDALLLGNPGDDPVALWRRESARSVRRFLDQALAASGGSERGLADGAQAAGSVPGVELRLSARNQLAATVIAVHHGEVMSTVRSRLGDGQVLTAAITRDGAEELDLAVGDAVVLIVKSTEVMVAKLGD